MKVFGKFSELLRVIFRTTSDNKEVTIQPPTTLTGASNTFTTPNISGTTDTMVSRASSDTGANALTNKDLNQNSVFISGNADSTKRIKFDADTNIPTATTKTFIAPNLAGASDTLVTLNQTQTLDAKTLTNASLQDSTVSFVGSVDATKKLQFEVDTNVPTATTKSLIVPTLSGASDTIVAVGATQTLTNKTLTSPTINGATIATSSFNGGTASSSQFITVPQDTAANITALSRTEGKLYYANDTNVLQIDNGTSLDTLSTNATATETTRGITYAKVYYEAQTAAASMGTGTTIDIPNLSSITLAAGTWLIQLAGYVDITPVSMPDYGDINIRITNSSNTILTDIDGMSLFMASPASKLNGTQLRTHVMLFAKYTTGSTITIKARASVSAGSTVSSSTAQQFSFSATKIEA